MGYKLSSKGIERRKAHQLFCYKQELARFLKVPELTEALKAQLVESGRFSTEQVNYHEKQGNRFQGEISWGEFCSEPINPQTARKRC